MLVSDPKLLPRSSLQLEVICEHLCKHLRHQMRDYHVYQQFACSEYTVDLYKKQTCLIWFSANFEF